MGKRIYDKNKWKYTIEIVLRKYNGEDETGFMYNGDIDFVMIGSNDKKKMYNYFDVMYHIFSELKKEITKEEGKHKF